MRLAIVAAIAAVCVATSGAMTLHVDCSGGGDYETIQDAVDAAGSGDTLQIAACVYYENVVVSGKCLTLLGAGSDVTEIRCMGPDEALDFPDMPSPWTVEIGHLRVRHTATTPESTSVHWPYGHVVVRDCEVSGTMRGDPNPGFPYGRTTIKAYDSVIGAINVAGHGLSRIERSAVGHALFLGYLDSGMWYLEPELHSIDNEYGGLVIVGGTCYSTDDSMDALGLLGRVVGVERWLALHATGSDLGTVTSLGDSHVDIAGCELDELTYEYDMGFSGLDVSTLRMRGTLVRGDVNLLVDRWCGNPTLLGNMHLTHNTILGDLTYDGEGCDPWLHHIRSNIIAGTASIGSGECMVVTHNVAMGGLYVSTPGDSVFANSDEDALFCAAAASDYTLEECSPCVGAGHDGGDIGAFSMGCSCATSVQELSEGVSWGRLKASYR